MAEAREEHERLHVIDARKLYMQAAEIFVKVTGTTENDVAFCQSQAAIAIAAVEALDRFKAGDTSQPTQRAGSAPVAQRSITKAQVDDSLSLLNMLPSVPSSSSTSSSAAPTPGGTYD